jgi:hypothetical protein
MWSKSESFEIRVEEIEAPTINDQAFLELWRSRDSDYVRRIIVGGLERRYRRNGETVDRPFSIFEDLSRIVG